MVLVNLADGSTQPVDPSTADGIKLAGKLLAAGNVTGLVLRHNGAQCALPQPRQFRSKPTYRIECRRKGESVVECIALYVDEVCVALSAASGSKLIRCDVSRVGSLRFSP